MQSIIVKKEMRLDALIIKEYPALTLGVLHKYMRQNKIKVNGKKIKLNTKLVVGDVINLYILDLEQKNDDIPLFMKANNNLNIMYEDENIMIVDKQAGLIVCDENNIKPDTLINRVMFYLYNKNEYNYKSGFAPCLCHRLDTGTSGLLIIAKNKTAYNNIENAIKNKNIQKKYLCVINGTPPKKTDVLTAYLLKNANSGTVKIFENKIKNSKKIITEYKILKKAESLTLLEINLITGKTHQIRAHLAYLNMPIIGDSKYGNLNLNRKYKAKYQLLCAYSLKFNNMVNGFEYLNNMEISIKKPWYVQQIILNGKL